MSTTTFGPGYPSHQPRVSAPCCDSVLAEPRSTQTRSARYVQFGRRFKAGASPAGVKRQFAWRSERGNCLLFGAGRAVTQQEITVTPIWTQPALPRPLRMFLWLQWCSWVCHRGYTVYFRGCSASAAEAAWYLDSCRWRRSFASLLTVQDTEKGTWHGKEEFDPARFRPENLKIFRFALSQFSYQGTCWEYGLWEFRRQYRRLLLYSTVYSYLLAVHHSEVN